MSPISKGLMANHSEVYIDFLYTARPKHAIQILYVFNKLSVTPLKVIFTDDYDGYISPSPLEQHNLTLFLSLIFFFRDGDQVVYLLIHSYIISDSVLTQ